MNRTPPLRPTTADAAVPDHRYRGGAHGQHGPISVVGAPRTTPLRGAVPSQGYAFGTPPRDHASRGARSRGARVNRGAASVAARPTSSTPF